MSARMVAVANGRLSKPSAIGGVTASAVLGRHIRSSILRTAHADHWPPRGV
jgi:hypothetical protein